MNDAGPFSFVGFLQSPFVFLKKSTSESGCLNIVTLFLFVRLCCDYEGMKKYGVPGATAAGRRDSDGWPFTFRRSRPLCWSIVRHLGIRRMVSITTTASQNAETITDKCLSMNSTCWVAVMSPAWCFVLIRANASNYLQMTSYPDPITSLGFVFLGNTNKFNTE